jgi:hypothetical protein
MPARVLLVAIDGACAALVDRLMDEGALPCLAGLRAAGASKPLQAPAGVTDDGLWASFHYGAGLGAHGRAHYLRVLPDGRTAMAHLGEDALQTWWERAPDLQVALFDLPKSRAPRPLHGLHLADWLVHGRYFTAPLSHPPGLAGDVVARFGAAPPSRCDHAHGPSDEADAAAILGNLRLSVSRKRAAGLHHLAAQAWDVFAIGFKEAHCAGHAFWNGLAVGPAAAPWPADDPQRVVLADVDAAIGALVTAAGPGAGVAVFTTTEMQANGTLDHLAPRPRRASQRRLRRASLAPAGGPPAAPRAAPADRGPALQRERARPARARVQPGRPRRRARPRRGSAGRHGRRGDGTAGGGRHRPAVARLSGSARGPVAGPPAGGRTGADAARRRARPPDPRHSGRRTARSAERLSGIHSAMPIMSRPLRPTSRNGFRIRPPPLRSASGPE